MWDWLGDLGDALGGIFSGAKDWLGNAGSAISNGVGTAANTVVDTGAGLFSDAGNMAAGLLGYGDLGAPAASMGSGLSGAADLASDVGSTMGSAMPIEGVGEAGRGVLSASNVGAGYTDPSVFNAGGETINKALDWAKNNPQLANSGLQFAKSLTAKNDVPQGYQRAAQLQDQGNQSAKDIAEQKTAVGQSMINQSPFYANNAEAGAMNTGAAQLEATKQRMTQLGYKPGDAMYDSAVQQQNIGNAQNRATAYGVGKNAELTGEAQGAGLLTSWQPNTSAYTQLGQAQQTQQQNENVKNSSAATAAQEAFNIWANPTQSNKQSNKQSGTIYN